EAGQADRVVRSVIGAAGVADGQRGHADAAERLHPLAEDRGDGVVLLQVDAADRAGAVVDVEVAGELRVLGLEGVAGLAAAAAAAALPGRRLLAAWRRRGRRGRRAGAAPRRRQIAARREMRLHVLP